MVKKTTLNEPGAMVVHVVKHMATKEDLAEIKGDVSGIKQAMATKDQIIALHTQANSIESQLRGMKHIKLEGSVADVEEKVFGQVRA